MAAPKPSHLHGSDLRAATRLATAATAGLVDLVEAVHARVEQFALPGAAIQTRTGGITGLVYRSVRGVTRGVGSGLDALWASLTPLLAHNGPAALPSAERDAVIAALNGVLGDHLAATHNPLATTMALRHAARALAIERSALQAALPQASGRIAVLVHGLCMNDRQWRRGELGHDHGAALARDGGWTPLYLHYNSGLPIATNGASFAALMDALIAQWPLPIERLAIIGHSMGGLVARSAVHTARRSRMPWLRPLGDLVCLGTPHLGAPLERAGHGVDVLLGVSSYSAAFTRLTKLRSAGITDLRHGRVVGDAGAPKTIGLPRGVRCHAIAGSLGRDASDLKHRLLGDGLVPLDSALGHHPDATRTLAVAKSRQTVVYQTGHLDLLSSPVVYAALKKALV